QGNRLYRGKHGLPPRPGFAMFGSIRVICVNEEVDVGNDHQLAISESQTPGTLDFKFVHELIQLCEINSSSESACFRLNSKPRHAPRRRCARGKTVTQRLIHNFLERPAAVSSSLLEIFCEVI